MKEKTCALMTMKTDWVKDVYIMNRLVMVKAW